MWRIPCRILFQSCMLFPYLSMLERNGLSLKILRVQFYFTRFNRVVHHLGRKKPRLLYWWFTAGTLLTIALIVPAVWVLVTTAASMLRSTATGKEESQILQPWVSTHPLHYYALKAKAPRMTSYAILSLFIDARNQPSHLRHLLLCIYACSLQHLSRIWSRFGCGQVKVIDSISRMEVNRWAFTTIVTT